ncbi:hypothetical protein [Polaromonas sp.]|uniref:hypothetical protein n=1 Tax=Polaromonas sp. TaxID=1869339 RepID=UPI00286C5C50|nr:hypothetical protein [Polaromonas sp.]
MPLWAGPASAQASAPPAFHSALEGYQSYTEEKTVDWKEANDGVGRIGGWREYAKQAQQPDKGDAASAASTTTAAPAAASAKPDPHAGHAKP